MSYPSKLLSDKSLRDRVVELYGSGLFMKQVAAQAGISETTVFKILKMEGVKCRPQGSRNGPVKMPQEKYDALLVDIRACTGTLTSIAEKHEVDISYVRFLCRKFEIEYYKRDNRNQRLFGTKEAKEETRKQFQDRLKERKLIKLQAKYGTLIRLWNEDVPIPEIAVKIGRSNEYVGTTVGRLRYRYPDLFPRRHLTHGAMTLEEHLVKERCRSETKKLRARGIILQQPCSVCGDPDSEVHHPDYSNPRLVEWYCEKHHKDVHVANGDASRGPGRSAR